MEGTILRTVGYNQVGSKQTWTNPDGETRTLYFEIAYVMQKFTILYDSYTKIIDVSYYVYNDGMGSEDSYPVIYAQNGTTYEKISTNEPLMQTAFSSVGSNGWINAEVSLTRNLVAGETIFFGFCGVFLCPKYDLSTTEYLYIYDYEDSSPQQSFDNIVEGDWYPLCQLSMYFTYYEYFQALDYTRAIATIASSSENLNHKNGIYIRKEISSVDAITSNPISFRNLVSRLQTVVAASVNNFYHNTQWYISTLFEHLYFIETNNRSLFKKSVIATYLSYKVNIQCSRTLSRCIHSITSLWESLFYTKRITIVILDLYGPICLDLEIESKI
jgi:hypothetical protein